MPSRLLLREELTSAVPSAGLAAVILGGMGGCPQDTRQGSYLYPPKSPSLRCSLLRFIRTHTTIYDKIRH